MVQDRFYIAVLPDDRISEEILQIKEWIKSTYGTARALNSPAHITLIPPFVWPSSRRDSLAAHLHDFAKKQRSFLTDLEGYGSFAPRVIFVRVLPNAQLATLQRSLEQFLAESLGIPVRDKYPFHPHITIAFRDLTEEAFYQAWQHFSPLDYCRSFTARSIALLQHNGRHWEIAGSYAMRESG